MAFLTYRRFLAIVGILLVFTVVPAPSRADSQPMLIYLQNNPFDPLRMPRIATPSSAGYATDLQLIQFSAPPDADAANRLEAAGYPVLAYIPDNAFLVRAQVAPTQQIDGLPPIRWSGAYPNASKLSPQLSLQLDNAGDERIGVRILSTIDANTAALEQTFLQLNGHVLSQFDTLNGRSWHVELPTGAVQSLITNASILWIEAYEAPTLLDDQANAIMNVGSARYQLGLEGNGQIVAITDTGLDVQSQVLGNANPDFPASQIVRGFSPSELAAHCSQSTWNDDHGHGTHVAGIVAGSGLRPGISFEGVAPKAKLVIQGASSNLHCFNITTTEYLNKAYQAGARIHNASWGLVTAYGAYDELARITDEFLWNHKDYLFVVAAGNQGKDANKDGIIDSRLINSPATAKNVLSVGASENNRTLNRPCSSSSPETWCWDVYNLFHEPFKSDQISDNPNGMAAFSNRGPTVDSRIKPEIVAPGTNIISTRSHMPTALYPAYYSNDYAYNSGTSMATPQISGMAALVRQWLSEYHGITKPSAALLKALLLNGAADMGAGQYGTGAYREIPSNWPNNVAGWGRADLATTIGLNSQQAVWFREHAGIQTGEEVEFTFSAAANVPVYVTLAWTDYPASPNVLKTLVNDLDLEVIAPNGTRVLGNAQASQSQGSVLCVEQGYDRCNTVESVRIITPVSGNYTLRVRGSVVPHGPQPFAIVAHAVAKKTLEFPSAPSTQTGILFLPLVHNGAP